MISVVYKFPRKNISKTLANGSFYYVLEYFLFLLSKNSNVKLYCIYENINELDVPTFIDYFESRYNINIKDPNVSSSFIECLKNNIFFVHIYDFNKIYLGDSGKDKVMTDYDTLENGFIRISLIGKKIYMLCTGKYYTMVHSDNTYDVYKVHKICTSNYNRLNIYEEGRFFTKKIYFDILKKPQRSEDACYINLKEYRNVSLKQYNEIIKPFINKYIPKNYKIIALVNNLKSNISYNLIKEIDKIDIYDTAIPDIMSKFNIYIDCMLNKFDYSPRMMLEAAYLGKKVLRIDKNKIDNGFIRYNDIMAGRIDKYRLNENDDLIKDLLENEINETF